MITIESHIYTSLVRAKTPYDTRKNLDILSRKRILKKLLREARAKNRGDLLLKNNPIPRVLEPYLIVNFEEKRSNICQCFMAIYQSMPDRFTLKNYLSATKGVFSVITQYRWADEDTSFVMRVITCYLQMNHREISEETLRKVIQDGPIKSESLSQVVEYYSLEDICQNLLKKKEGEIFKQNQATLSLEILHLQKAFKQDKKVKTFFSQELLDLFLSEDPDILADDRERSEVYITKWRIELIRAMNNLSVKKGKKYTHEIEGIDSFSAILYWMNLITKQG